MSLIKTLLGKIDISKIKLKTKKKEKKKPTLLKEVMDKVKDMGLSFRDEN